MNNIASIFKQYITFYNIILLQLKVYICYHAEYKRLVVKHSLDSESMLMDSVSDL